MIVKIQNRRGEYLDYDPSKLLPGEFAVVQMGDPNTPTGKGVYLAITAGDVVRLATTEEIATYTQQFDDIYHSTIQDAGVLLEEAKRLISNYTGGLTVVDSVSEMTDIDSLYLYNGSGQYKNYVYIYDPDQSEFVPLLNYGTFGIDRYKSYTASTDSVESIYTPGIYFIGNSVAGKPLGTTGSGTGGVLIVGGYGTQDENIVKLYIYMSQNTEERKGIYMRTFAGTRDYGWIKIPDDLIDRSVKKLIIPQAEIIDMPEASVAMPTLTYHAKIQQTTGVSGAKATIFKNGEYFCITYGENLDGTSGDFPKVTSSGVLAMKYKFFKFSGEAESNVSYGTFAEKGGSYIDYTGATKTFVGGCGLPSGVNGKQFFTAAFTGTNRYNGFDNYGMTPCVCDVSVSSSGVTFGNIYELRLNVGGESGRFDLTRIDPENVNYNLYITTAPPSYANNAWHWIQPGKHSLIYMTSTDAISWTYRFSIPTDFDPCCEVSTVVYNGYILAAVRTWGSSSDKYTTSTLYLMLINTSGSIVHQYRIPNVSTRSYLVKSGDNVLLFYNPYNKTTSECIRITSLSGAIENGLYFHRWFTIHENGSWYITCNEDTVSSENFTDMYIAGGNDSGPSTENGMEFIHLKFDGSLAHDPQDIDLSAMNDTLLTRVSKLQKNLAWSSDSIVKITTSITDYVSSHANGVYYLWSTSSNATAVGAPSANSYHYLVIKVNSSAAIIQAHRMTTGDDVFYVKQLYGGSWGSSWTQIANQSDVDTISSDLTTLTNKVVKTTLSTTQTYANATSGTYNYQAISGLSDYDVVLVRVDCGNIRQWLTFVNGDTTPLYLWDYSGTNAIRCGVYVDWTNNRVYIRYLQAAGSYTSQHVSFSQVVGFIKL